MNIRLQKYKKNRILGMNMYNAAISAGYAHNYASQACLKIEPKISFNDYLDRVGLTDKQLAIKLSELLEATKVIGYLHNYRKQGNGRIEKMKPDEVISNEFLETPDWSNRKEGLKLVLQSKKLLDTKLIDQSQHTHITKVELKVSDDTKNPLTQQAGNRLSGQDKI